MVQIKFFVAFTFAAAAIAVVALPVTGSHDDIEVDLPQTPFIPSSVFMSICLMIIFD